jgi:TorA maturation chaperone TorD
MASESITFDEFRQLAQSRSKFYGFLSSLYVRIPNGEFGANLFGDKLQSFLPSIASLAEVPAEMKEGLGMIQGFAQQTKDRSHGKLVEELGVDWTRLLRGLKPGYGPPPPYESVYSESSEQEGRLTIGDVLKTYREAGVDIGEKAKERPDYIGIELDFMRYLAEKEMEGWNQSAYSEGAKYLEMERDFLTRHLTQWVPKFCDKMLTEARTDLYRGVARLTKGFLTLEGESIEGYIALAERSLSLSSH